MMSPLLTRLIGASQQSVTAKMPMPSLLSVTEIGPLFSMAIELCSP